MDSEEFKYFRKRLNRTQMQIAELLGTSLKAIQSYGRDGEPYRPMWKGSYFFWYPGWRRIGKKENLAI